MVETPTKGTKLVIDVTQVVEQVPLMVFKYDDLYRFTNVPNFNQFVDNSNHFAIDDRSDLKFDLADIDGNFLPKSAKNYSLNEDEVIEYPVMEKGVYCVYFPLTEKQYQIYSEGTYAHIRIKDEAVPMNLGHELSIHIVLASVYGSMWLLLRYYFPVLSAPKSSTVPYIPKILQIVIGSNFVYYFAFVIMDAVVHIIHCGYFYSFMQNYYVDFQTVLINLQGYLISLIYLGAAYRDLFRMKTTRKVFTFLFIIHAASMVVAKQIMQSTRTTKDLTFNGHSYEVLHASILVNSLNKSSTINSETSFIKKSITLFTLIQIVTGVILQFQCLVCGIKLNRYFKKTNQKNLSKPMFYSILFHLVGWTYMFRHLGIMKSLEINLDGVFDVNEILYSMGNIIAWQEINLLIVDLFEIVLIWFVWSSRAPLIVKKPEENEKNDKNNEKDIDESHIIENRSKETNSEKVVRSKTDESEISGSLQKVTKRKK
ncbi:uncharacterized protein J8A68_003404 [[Candida] subhashii]|uniref:Uncharacterized protein n=1 Tax=[Candida] subhashii TaxID=561895 RepID=A0A8J5UM40_9ASCO|nr:uncharacterized protein J8A68_003404 [[Candida] subhashii]KAG7663061.1 hypothetical protein J8A68_003404 [[Candida] subhashii]